LGVNKRRVLQPNIRKQRQGRYTLFRGVLAVIFGLPGAQIYPVLNQPAFLNHLLINLLVNIWEQVSDVPDILARALAVIKKFVFEHH
jgi:hypothetical protein